VADSLAPAADELREIVAAGWLVIWLAGNSWPIVSARDIRYMVPIGEPAPAKFCKTYPQPLSTGRAGGGVCPAPPAPAPHIEEISAGGPCTPQQNIFAKVRSRNMASDLRLCNCAVNHSTEYAKWSFFSA